MRTSDKYNGLLTDKCPHTCLRMSSSKPTSSRIWKEDVSMAFSNSGRSSNANWSITTCDELPSLNASSGCNCMSASHQQPLPTLAQMSINFGTPHCFLLALLALFWSPWLELYDHVEKIGEKVEKVATSVHTKAKKAQHSVAKVATTAKNDIKHTSRKVDEKLDPLYVEITCVIVLLSEWYPKRFEVLTDSLWSIFQSCMDRYSWRCHHSLFTRRWKAIWNQYQSICS